MKSPCLYLGPPTGTRVLCKTCGGKTELKLLACTIHGHCTVKTKVENLACCPWCADYQPA